MKHRNGSELVKDQLTTICERSHLAMKHRNGTQLVKDQLTAICKRSHLAMKQRNGSELVTNSKRRGIRCTTEWSHGSLWLIKANDNFRVDIIPHSRNRKSGLLQGQG